MIPPHLANFQWKADHFFSMDNKKKMGNRWAKVITWDLSAEGANDIISATPEIIEIIPVSKIAASNVDVTVVCDVCLTVLGKDGTLRKWGNTASDTSGQYGTNKMGERSFSKKKFTIGQLAYTNALKRAVKSYLKITQDDIDEIVKRLGLTKATVKVREEEEIEEPESPQEVVEEVGDVTGLGSKFGI
jgi:hypothetical protein